MPKGCDLVATVALPVAFGTSHVVDVIDDNKQTLDENKICN